VNSKNSLTNFGALLCVNYLTIDRSVLRYCRRQDSSRGASFAGYSGEHRLLVTLRGTILFKLPALWSDRVSKNKNMFYDA